ncbi:MAG: AAA family ATPase [Bacteroidota bacterium]
MSIFNHFKHLTLTSDQVNALKLLEGFVNSDESLFLLKGYAGSGKTTVLQGFVEYLESMHKRYILMAPTGRAAKVLSEKTGKNASTIYRAIYSYSLLEDLESQDGDDESSSFVYYYKLANNTTNDIIYIVDEASMISDKISMGEFFRFGSGFLLSDLISYSHTGELNSRNKIIFVGDPCQLEPVSDSISPALDEQYIKEKFGLNCMIAELREVKRQTEQSGILKAATRLRKSQSSGYFNDFDLTENGIDIYNPSFDSFLDTWQEITGKKVIIAYKNKTCLDLNIQIRERLFGEGKIRLQQSDIVILGANNYTKGVYNGEFAVVSSVDNIPRVEIVEIKKKVGNVTENKSVRLVWRAVELVFPDSEKNGKVVKGQVLENFLYGDNYLHPDEMRALYVDFKIRHKELKPRTEEFKEAILNDPYFHCLKIKYGYAVTCHKAQGGEWENVFTVWEHNSAKNISFFRWAYTAVTRASKRLYAIDPPYFNSYSLISLMNDQVTAALNQLTGVELVAQEIDPDDFVIDQLRKFGLIERPLPIQDHFLGILQRVRQHYIDIIGWEQKNLEIFYKFGREGNTAGFKTWINKDTIFNGKFLKVSSLTNNEEFANEVDGYIRNFSPVIMKRNTTEIILQDIEFEIAIEEQYPFLRILYDDLTALLAGKEIAVESIKHMQYRERYTFSKGGYKLLLDFEYDSAGFFGRVLPVKKQSDNGLLLSEISEVITELKNYKNAGKRD